MDPPGDGTRRLRDDPPRGTAFGNDVELENLDGKRYHSAHMPSIYVIMCRIAAIDH